jgi:hypothetical protein
MNNGVTVVRNKNSKDAMCWERWQGKSKICREWVKGRMREEKREEEEGKKISDVLNVAIVGNIIFYWERERERERERGSLRNYVRERERERDR